MSETSDRLTPQEQREYILFKLNGWGFDEESLIEVSGMLDYFEKAVARAAFKEAAAVVREWELQYGMHLETEGWLREALVVLKDRIEKGEQQVKKTSDVYHPALHFLTSPMALCLACLREPWDLIHSRDAHDLRELAEE